MKTAINFYHVETKTLILQENKRIFKVSNNKDIQRGIL